MRTRLSVAAMASPKLPGSEINTVSLATTCLLSSFCRANDSSFFISAFIFNGFSLRNKQSWYVSEDSILIQAIFCQ
jgi:formylmethanofuran dehydrogenase subunit E-like metal-binding protein